MSTTTMSSATIAASTTTMSPLQATLDFAAYLVVPPICWTLTVLCCGAILFCLQWRAKWLVVKKGEMSGPMRTLLFTHLGNNLVFLLSQYGVNNLVQLNPSVINASGWLNTWWSFFVGNYLMAVPAANFFLILERFLTLKMNLSFDKFAQRRLARIGVAVQLLLYAFSLWNVLLAWPYDKMCIDPGTENNPIANRPCLPLINRITNFSQQGIKISFAFLNLLISIAFLAMLYRNKIPNVRNGIVKMTIACELLFDVIPSLLSLLFSVLATDLNLSLNVYTFLMASLDAAICASTYSYLVFKCFRRRRSAVDNDAKLAVTAVTSRSLQMRASFQADSNLAREINSSRNNNNITRPIALTAL